MKKMTEKEAWAALAEAWDNPKTSDLIVGRGSYTHIVNPFDGYRDKCLCDGTMLDDSIEEYDIQLPSHRMAQHLEWFNNGNIYFWPLDHTGAKQRMWTCLFLAAISDRS